MGVICNEKEREKAIEKMKLMKCQKKPKKN